ncbi:MAG TPA: hypothetical protein PLZ56_09890 [Anaerolineae bacterium]|nr:hypothetical protein [Anaerolineae bacterium]
MTARARFAALAVAGIALAYAAPAVEAQGAIDDACSRGGWHRVPFSADRTDASVYLLSAGRDRIYASAHWGDAPNDVWQTLSAAMEGPSLTVLNTLEGQRLSDLLMTPSHPNTLAWASGFGDRNLFGALAASPTGFALKDAHAQARCLSCHRSLVFAKVGTACADCHRDAHKGALGFRCED